VLQVTASSHDDDGIEVQPTTAVSPDVNHTTNPGTDVADENDKVWFPVEENERRRNSSAKSTNFI
jgi:hypothetical protein